MSVEQTAANLNNIFRGAPPITINGGVVERNSISATLPAQILYRNRKTARPAPQARNITSVNTPPPELNKNIVPETVLNNPPTPQIKKKDSSVEDLAATKKFTIPARNGDTTPISLDLSKVEVPDFQSMSEKQKAQERAELILKLNIIRNSHSNYNLPNFSEHPDLPLENLYLYHQGFATYLSVSKVIRSYKTYWILGCLFAEVVCCSLGITSAKGYTSMQIRNSVETEMLLAEIGCSSVASNGVEGSSWPAEIRMIFTSLLSLLIFVVVKALLKKLGLGENHLDSICGNIFDYLSGKKEIPAELTAGITQGITDNPTNPLSGIFSNFNIGNIAPMLSGFFGGNTPAATTTNTPTTYLE